MSPDNLFLLCKLLLMYLEVTCAIFYKGLLATVFLNILKSTETGWPSVFNVSVGLCGKGGAIMYKPRPPSV